MPRRHEAPTHTPDVLHGIVTVSPMMHRVFEITRKVARSQAPVLFRGQTGSGKELFARALHAMSQRASGPFHAINCATLTGEMLASELFGHVKGAFTGAIRARPGLFKLADRGTLFLDELAEMPLDLQARLLRVLQDNTFTPLGGTESIQVDVRIVSATHRALRSAVLAGTFREDLMYRVRVVPIYLPTLAERRGDVEALAWHFITAFNARTTPEARRVRAVDGQAMQALLAHSWPGNVRELRNVIEYAFAIGDGEVLTWDELTPELRGEAPPDENVAPQRPERARIIEALSRSQGRKGEAAELLGMSRTTLWRKMREYHLH